MEVVNQEIIDRSGNTVKLFLNRLQVLYIGQLVYNIFYLVLVSVVKFLPEIIYKNSDFSQVFPQRDFELGPSRQYQDIGSHFLFMIFLLIQSSLFEEHGGKKNLIATSKIRYSKIVFVLLDEVVIIHVQLALINVQCFMLKSLLWEVLGNSLILAINRKQLCLQYCLRDPLKIIFIVFGGLGGS